MSVQALDDLKASAEMTTSERPRKYILGPELGLSPIWDFFSFSMVEQSLLTRRRDPKIPM
jgi:hypothetical protein